MKIVRVTIEGGVVQWVEVPEGVTIFVRDYDVDGSDDAELQQDDNGDMFIEVTWEHQ